MASRSLPLPPADALARLLPPEVSLDGGTLRHEAARPVWIGMVWSRMGDYATAFAFWDRVGAPDVQPWLAAERGRVLRELGLHSDAERLEVRALADADDPVDRAMLRISLTADAVGRNDIATARRRLKAARDEVATLADSPRAARQRLRIAWVEIEVALIAGTPPRTDHLLTWDPETATATFSPDHAHATAFHRAKSLLFVGSVTATLSLLDAATTTAPTCLLWPIHLARHSLHTPHALSQARDAWTHITLPHAIASKVRATPTARLLTQPPPEQDGREMLPKGD